MRIPITALKELASKYNLSHIILFAHHPGENKDHIVTYGKTLEDCSQAADFGNALKDLLGWPQSLHTQPSRVRQLQKRIKELESELDNKTTGDTP